MRRDEALAAVLFAKFRLLDFAGRVARHFGENNAARTFVTRKRGAKRVEVVFRRRSARLQLDDSRRNFAETRVGKADDRDVFNIVMTAHKVFNLNRINVFAAADDDVFLAVDEVNEAVFVFARHIAGVKPTVREGRGGRFRVAVIFRHDAGAADGQFADFALRNRVARFVDDRRFPTVAGFADRANFLDIFDAQVNAAGADRLAETVIGVVLVVRETLAPTADKARRIRLGGTGCAPMCISRHCDKT